MNYSDELKHYGTLGQKWGVRRYQNPDGTLTDAGKARYGYGEGKKASRTARDYQKSLNRMEKNLAQVKSEKARAEVRMGKAANAGKEKRYAKNKKYYEDMNAREKVLSENIRQKSNEAQDKGYLVKGQDITRFAQGGRMFLRMELTGVLGGLALSAVDTARYGNVGSGWVNGKKWNVAKQMKLDDASDDVKYPARSDGQSTRYQKADGSLTKDGQKVMDAVNKNKSNQKLDPKDEAYSYAVRQLYQTDKTYRDMVSKKDKLENKYLDIAEDDFTPHDASYQAKLDQAKKELDDYREKLNKYREANL